MSTRVRLSPVRRRFNDIRYRLRALGASERLPEVISWIFLGVGAGFILGIATRLRWLSPLPEEFSKFLTTVATVLGSIAVSFSLWFAQRRARSNNVESAFREILQDLNIQSYELEGSMSEQGYFDRHVKYTGLAKWASGRTRTTRNGLEQANIPLSDQELMLQAMMVETRVQAPAFLEVLKKTVTDVEALKTEIPDLLPEKLVEFVRLRKRLINCQDSLLALAGANYEDPVRWHQSLEYTDVEGVIRQLRDWMEGR